MRPQHDVCWHFRALQRFTERKSWCATAKSRNVGINLRSASLQLRTLSDVKYTFECTQQIKSAVTANDTKKPFTRDVLYLPFEIETLFESKNKRKKREEKNFRFRMFKFHFQQIQMLGRLNKRGIIWEWCHDSNACESERKA